MSDGDTDLTEQPVGLGHNLPPEETLPDKLARTYADLVGKVANIEDRAVNHVPPITNEELSKRATDFLGQIGEWKKHVEALFSEEKQPWLAGSRAVDTFFNGVRGMLAKADKAVRDKQDMYLRQVAERERQERLAREQAAREAAEALRKQAAEAERLAREQNAPPPSEAVQQELLIAATALETRADEHKESAAAKVSSMTQVRGDHGKTAALRDNWIFDGLDRETIDLEKLRPYLTLADLEKAVRAAIKAGARPKEVDGVEVQPIRGVRIFNRPTTALR